MSTVTETQLPAGYERFDAALDTTGDTPRLTGSVDPTSIAVREEHFHEHLQGPDFFDTERHPEIAFESTGWRTDGDVLVVDGNLTIKGDTRPINRLPKGGLALANEVTLQVDLQLVRADG